MESIGPPAEQLHDVASGGVKLDASTHLTMASDGSRTSAKYPRLSSPVPMMRSEYDVVVVGSGYGGGVAASRMSRAGKRVAILELGKEKWPGEYPSDVKDALPEVHVTGNAGHFEGPLRDVAAGNKTGLYHLILGEGQNAFVGNGLGGTSLLNANVFLEADKRTLQFEAWPQEIRADPSCLDPYYALAAHMLQPTPYPEDYPPLNKLRVLEKQAKALGHEANFYRVPQTTFFHNGLNNVGVEMKASTGSGQDCTGVNDGSKHSVLMNYLPDAWNWGAEIFCECEVRYVLKAPDGKGYLVLFAWHGDGRESFKDGFYNQLMWVRAKELCFLAAGSLGSTEILLRSKKHGLKTSRFVGQKLSGNGDILSFGYNTDEIVNGIGSEHPPLSTPCGPTITGVIDNRGASTSPNPLDGYVIEEGAIPQALAPMIQAMLDILPGKEHPDPFTLTSRLRHLLSAAKSRLLGPYARGSSVNRMQTYLIMSHDSNEGILSLDGDKVYLQFLGVGRTEHVKRLNRVLADATKAIGGTLVNSPFYAAFHQQEEITVHPLGGAIMSSDGTGVTGATNHIGQLFTGDGAEVHEGLVCVDGSVVPTALGVNPFATITALAERSVHLIAKNIGCAIDTSPNGKLDLLGRPAKSFPLTQDMLTAGEAIRSASPLDGGIRFTEIMDGYIHVGDDIDDFVVAEDVAKGAASSAKFYLSVDVYSVKNLIDREDHASLATGTFSCGALSPDPMLVLRGSVQFFTLDDSVSDGINLTYKLTLLTTKGNVYLLNGYKEIDAGMAFSAVNTWKATTTLNTTITRLSGDGGEVVVGRGRLHIGWRNFGDELKSFGSIQLTRSGVILNRNSNSGGALRFLSFFTRNVARFFFTPLAPLEYPDASHTGYFDKIPPARIIELTASDGVKTSMKMWAPQATTIPGLGDQGKGKMMPILMIPGASVDDQIFSLPTIFLNTVEYFTARGYTVYVPTHRMGKTLIAEEGWTAYDARLDVGAAVEYVYNAHQRDEHDETKGKKNDGKQKIYVICHCIGALATSMSLLDGTIDAEYIAGMTASQVFYRPHFTRFNSLKARTSVLVKLYEGLFRTEWLPMDASSSSSSPRWLQSFLDQLLRFYPIYPPSELCRSTVCHRLDLVFNRLWNHSNLTRATHEHLINFVGGIHMHALAHLMSMGTKHEVTAVSRNLNADVGTDRDIASQSLVTPENLERLAKIKQVLFLSGGQNQVYSPVSTSVVYDEMREMFGFGERGNRYERVVVAGYGHLDTWMGERSFVDVFPVVGGHVEACEGRPGL
ncbi:FAD/NAD(P)-binding domain-containing protein [Favolaschia claudopus]|uniref:Cholesterol oxidase n=1 Tax=Favolaschia claudopus TaxID=2862362 RepID=A0AAW0CSU7_9AGAR